MSNVSHPAHYNAGRIEVIEAIEDWKLNYHKGNAVKYIARAGKKDPAKTVEDLEKAVWYLKREIEGLTAASRGEFPCKPNDMNPRKSDPSEAKGTLNPHDEICLSCKGRKGEHYGGNLRCAISGDAPNFVGSRSYRAANA